MDIKFKHPMPTQDPLVRNKNFKEVALGYDEKTAVEEAKRCLNCKNRPCVSGYSETVNQITAGYASGFDIKTKDIVFFAYTAMPGILALLSTIPMFKYDICGDKKADIAKKLAERRKK